MARIPVRTRSIALRLYVAGTAPNSVRAVANAQSICDAHFLGRHELEVVDLLRHPDRGIDDGIIVTPTLIKLRPRPVTRLIGDLSDTTQVLAALGVT